MRAGDVLAKGIKNIAILSAAAISLMLSVTLGSAQQQSDTPNNPFAHDPAAPVAGRALFNSTCSACHGQDATGGRGPALANGTFIHGGSDYEIFQTIRGGVAGTQMPNFSALPSDDVWRLVTYIKSLSNGGAAAGQVASGDAAAGQALFFGAGNCTSCHEINGRGSDIAADLSAEGQRPFAAIRASMMHVIRGFRGPTARMVSVTTKDGRKFDGITRAEDSFSVDLEQHDGSYALLDARNVASITQSGSLTPANTLTPTQMDDIAAYLATQKKRDFTQTSQMNPAPVLTYDRIAKADPRNWATYWGDYKGFHFSALNQITPGNVRSLAGRWSAPLLGESVMEATPIVVDGIMYMSGSPGEVYALDAKSGMILWSFKRRTII
jgi:mono/diheme cytochrome c family protein